MTTLSETKSKFAFVIDGKSLAYALRLYPTWFRQLCEKCNAVLCCRMSPLQKAQVVSLVKKSESKPVTCAIGDGANDVSMIQEANVGLAIMGKEGRQAVINSDYAFGQFRFLHRILLYHGYLYYNRLAVLVQYFFYKNMAWITGQVFYSFFNAHSQQTLYDPFFLTMYNIAFTSIPILIYGLFEQTKSQEVLMSKPHVYKSITKNSVLKWNQFLKWNILALWHATVFFYGVYLVMQDDVPIFSTGKGAGNFCFGSLVFYVAVITVNIKLMLETYHWDVPTLLGYLFTLFAIIILSLAYNLIFWPPLISTQNSMYGVVNALFSSWTTLLSLLILVAAALLPDIVIRVWRDTRWMMWSNNLHEMEDSSRHELTRHSDGMSFQASTESTSTRMAVTTLSH